MRRLLVILSIIFVPSFCWSFSISDNTWIEKNPTVTATFGGYDGAYFVEEWACPIAYDSVGHRFILFDKFVDGSGTDCVDGVDQNIYSNALWAWDVNANTVTLLNVLDSYTGVDGTSMYQCPGSTDPTPRHGAIAYAKGKIWISPGLNNRDEASGHPDDIWSYTLPDGPWAEATYPATAPEVGDDTAIVDMVFDPASDLVVMANISHTAYGTDYTWRFDPDDITGTLDYWTSSRPTITSIGDSLTVDTRRNRIWKFGSGVYSTGSNDLWWLETSTGVWTEVTENGTLPDARNNHAFTYNSAVDVLMVYGGAEGADSSSYLSDLWVYAPLPNAWKQLETSGPDAGKWVAGDYDNYNNVFGIRTYANPGVDQSPGWWGYRYTPYNHDTSAHATSALSQPAAGSWTLDPDYGGWFLRLADMRTSNGYAHHIYSDLQAFSKDSTYLYVQTDSGNQVWALNADMTGYTLYDGSPGTDTNAYWSPVDDSILYYWSGDSIMYYDADTKSTGTVADMGTEDGWSSVDSSLIKMCSNNGRYHAVIGLKDSSWVIARVDDGGTLCDGTVTLGTVFSSPCTDVEVYISPDGDYIISNCSTGYPRSHNAATGAFVSNPMFEYGSPHADVIKDSNGTQWFVYQQANDGEIQKIEMDGTNKTSLLTINRSMHISARQSSGDYVIVSTYDGSPGTNSYAQEVFRLYLDSTPGTPHIERILHHRSTYGDGASDYYCQPHASVSPDGNWIVFGSDWGATGNDAHDIGGEGVEPYIAWLPPPSEAVLSQSRRPVLGAGGAPYLIGGMPVVIE